MGEVSKDLMLDIGIVGIDDDMPARFTLKLEELMPTTLFQLAGNALAPAAGRQRRAGTRGPAARRRRDGRPDPPRL